MTAAAIFIGLLQVSRRRPILSTSRSRAVYAGKPFGASAEDQMRYIDAFNHFFPPRFFAAMLETPAGSQDLGKRMRGIPAVHDIDVRLRVLDEFDNLTQVLSLGLPPAELLVGPDRSPELNRLGNDGLAELTAKYPERFVGYAASLPMDVPEAAAREAERVFANGACA